jgi:hypothetical protein
VTAQGVLQQYLPTPVISPSYSITLPARASNRSRKPIRVRILWAARLVGLALFQLVRKENRRAAIKSFPQGNSCDQFIHSADASHGERFRSSPHGYLLDRESIHFDASGGRNDVGHDKLTAVIFS